MYPEFEQLMCIGCHYKQPYVMDETKDPKEIRLCKTFAKNLYGAELDGPTFLFDKCGLLVSGDYSDAATHAFGDGSTTVVIPSEHPEWQTAEGFFNDPALKPPLFSDYKIVLVDDGPDCFNQGMKLGFEILAAISATVYLTF